MKSSVTFDKEGFTIFPHKDYDDFVCIDSTKIEACMEFFQKNHFKNVMINKQFGYLSNNLDFLKDYSKIISGIHIVSDDIDIMPIHYLTNLECLLIGHDYENIGIDFLTFPTLRYAWFTWNKQHKNLDKCVKMHNLGITKYKKNDLSELSQMTHLRLLDLRLGTVKSFLGVENMDNLSFLDIYRLTKLSDLSTLLPVAKSLKKLIFNSCSKIHNYEFVTNLLNIEVLAFNACGSIPSLSFINTMKGHCLRSFRFVDTNILDGDLSPCIGLDYAGFSNKKYYSHTFEQIQILNLKHR